MKLDTDLLYSLGQKKMLSSEAIDVMFSSSVIHTLFNMLLVIQELQIKQRVHASAHVSHCCLNGVVDVTLHMTILFSW